MFMMSNQFAMVVARWLVTWQPLPVHRGHPAVAYIIMPTRSSLTNYFVHLQREVPISLQTLKHFVLEGLSCVLEREVPRPICQGECHRGLQCHHHHHQKGPSQTLTRHRHTKCLPLILHLPHRKLHVFLVRLPPGQPVPFQLSPVAFDEVQGSFRKDERWTGGSVGSVVASTHQDWQHLVRESGLTVQSPIS